MLLSNAEVDAHARSWFGALQVAIHLALLALTLSCVQPLTLAPILDPSIDLDLAALVVWVGQAVAIGVGLFCFLAVIAVAVGRRS